MSRIGKQPIPVPNGVEVTIADGVVKVKGPKGELQQTILPGMTVKQENTELIVSRPDDEKMSRSFHGLTRTLIANMVIGVSEGFSKELEVEGVGFKANASGQLLTMSLGFSHDVKFQVPEGVTVEAKNNQITVSGIDKQQVGQVAAEIRALKKPEPYKGKGIRYKDEYIVRKAGKTAAG